jgi:hypothetical protein
MKDVNDDDMLVLSSFEEVLQVNEKEKYFYNTMRNIVERTYRRTLHFNTKINPMTPKTRLYKNYMKHF